MSSTHESQGAPGIFRGIQGVQDSKGVASCIREGYKQTAGTGTARASLPENQGGKPGTNHETGGSPHLRAKKSNGTAMKTPHFSTNFAEGEPASKEDLRKAALQEMDLDPGLQRNMGGKLAERLRRTSFYKKAGCVFVSPHPLLHQACLNVLTDRKLLILPGPQVQTGFHCLSPSAIPVPQRKGILRQLGGKKTTVPKIDYSKGPEKKIDLLLTMALTCGRDGSMVADGHGHFDLQYAILDTLEWLTSDALVAAFLGDDRFLRSAVTSTTDVPANQVLTPAQTLETSQKGRKRSSILWEELTEKQIRRNDALFFLKNTQKKTPRQSLHQ